MKKLLLSILFLLFSVFPIINNDGKNLEAKILKLLGDKDSIETTLIPFVDFDWDTVRVVRYARYVANSNVCYVYSFEFRSSSGEVIRQVVLPLRFTDVDYQSGYVVGYNSSPYLERSRDGKIDSLDLGKKQKFKIYRTSSICRDGGNDLAIKIKI